MHALPARLAARLLALLLFAPAAPAAAYSDVFVFGDSLSDTGNVCTGLTTTDGYATGRCSNGDVWSERFAEALGESAEPFPVDPNGTNFAFGGAVTDDLSEQIAEFESRILFGDAPSDALYVIWIGGNDVLDTPSAPNAMADAAGRVADAVEELRDLGAEEFLVVNLPDIGRVYGGFSFPEGSGEAFTPAERDELTALTTAFNAELDLALGPVSGVTIHRLDVFSVLEVVIEHPPVYGFSEAAVAATPGGKRYGLPCLVDADCQDDPQGAVADTFILFDALHPTTAAHGLIAERAVLAVPEPGAGPGALAALGLLVALAAGARRARPVRAPPPGGPARSTLAR